jgi:hypothetical protein
MAGNYQNTIMYGSGGSTQKIDGNTVNKACTVTVSHTDGRSEDHRVRKD